MKTIVTNFFNTITDYEDAIPTDIVLKIDDERRKGLSFIISTNHHYNDILFYDKSYHFIDYIISCNGSLVYDVSNKNIIYEKKISKNIINNIIKNIDNDKIIVYKKDNIYKLNDNIDDIYKIDIKNYNKKDLEYIKSISNINYYINNKNIEIINKLTNKYKALLKINNNKDIYVLGYDNTDIELLDNINNAYIVSNSKLKKYKKLDNTKTEALLELIKLTY